MHDVAPADGNVRRVAIFNPGSNRSQASRLRLVNPTDAAAEVMIRGTDDRGASGAGEVTLTLDSGTAREITAAELESGAAGLEGMLGDGAGKWRLEVVSEQPVVAMSLLESPTDHLTNLSTVPPAPGDGGHTVPLFPAAGDASGRQGFLRVVNRSDSAGEVRIEAFDETDRDYGTLTLSVGGGETAHFNSDDLEQGSPRKGLSGGTGAGEGDWRLRLTSDLDLEVLAYVRTADGFLTAMHDVAPSAGNRHRIAVFNPGSNRGQASLLRVVNPGDDAATVTVAGIDDKGDPGAGEVGFAVPAGRSRTVAAWELEDGGADLDGALGNGAGKWWLAVTADAPVLAMSLLRSPTGHLTNLSTAPGRGAAGSAGEETAEDVFRDSVSPIVQSKCVNCHVEGGTSGNTRLVFVRAADDENHLATNLAVFEDFLAEVEDGADLILNKIQGVGHGGGIQVAAGTEEYADMERFLSLLGEDIGPVAITPDTLFDGVRMEPARNTLRRAAIVFAGRVPTEAEYASLEGATGSEFRAAIRAMMDGTEFHEFLVRAANDRLFTDRDGTIIDGASSDDFVDFANLYHEKAVASRDELRQWEGGVQYGIRRAPLELIAHVAENDLPYTEILTADYILANSLAAEAYGASTTFDDAGDVHEFRPSEIVSYYRDGPGKVSEYSLQFGTKVTDPGNLATDYPHAGILNTTVFLNRYPTTATNRNRARSRWTYYHFLGLDVEKSAPRTTDPAALADTNNPTMHNLACTACHVVLDPVAGAFQNYGDEGFYRDQWGGMDSLDEFYKEGKAPQVVEVEAKTYESRETVSATVRLSPAGLLAVQFVNDYFDEDSGADRNLFVDRLIVREEEGGEPIFEVDLEDLTEDDLGEGDCGLATQDTHFAFYSGCRLRFDVDVPIDAPYRVEAVAWADQYGEELAQLSFSEILYRNGDTWYRDMREPGFDGELVPDADNSLRWLAERIVEDKQFAEATVTFWWPAIMGSEVAEPPEDEGDADFEGRLLASNAQAAEVQRQARGFRRGFQGRTPYNLKDLLVEIVLSRWFRVASLEGDDPVRATALRNAGGRRLLTPEELARKTLALTGFQWGRPRAGTQTWRSPERQRWSQLPDTDRGYGLLYGGIDSAGVTERATDLTSVMAGVAKSHAIESSCPIVMREFYLVPEEERLLFGGIGKSVSPVSEFGSVFDVEAASRERRETVSLTGELTAGAATVTVAFVNNETGEETDRNLHVDRLDVRDADGDLLASRELEEVSGATGCEWNRASDTHFSFFCNGALEIDISIPADGRYSFDIVAWADQNPQDPAKMEVSVGTDTERSAGARSIKEKLVGLYDRLHGIAVTADSPEVAGTYDLFVEVWQRRRESQDIDFFGWGEGIDCDWGSDRYYLDGIVEGAFVYREDWGDEWGARYDWDRDRIDAYFETVDWSDPQAVAETWTVILAYLLMDYRYLYL